MYKCEAMRKIPDVLLDYGYWLIAGQEAIPEKSGVYVILSRLRDAMFYDIIYIGSTSNLKRRISGHEVISQFKRGNGVTGIRCHFREASNYREIEVAMIQKHAPLANKNHQLHGQ